WVLCPIIAAIVALFIAHSSDKEIKESGGSLGGAGLNTATRIISWINIVVYALIGILVGILVAAGVLFASSPSNPFNLDPTMNSRTGLPDGSYVMNSVGVRFNINDECSYGDVASTLDGVAVQDVSVYGKGPIQCPDLVQVSAVYFEVTNGEARILSVE
ncbi:MAG: hypothetical protein ACKOT0_02565, partial [bacterium]